MNADPVKSIMSRLRLLDPQFKPAFDGPAIARSLITQLSGKKTVLLAYLFGSAAQNKNTVDSDLDLLVIVPDGSEIKSYYEVVNSAFFSPVAVDWIFITESEFNKNSEIGGISMIAKQQGIGIKPHG